MSTIIREPYPEAKSYVAMWTYYMQYEMMDWPDLGSAIQSRHKYVIERPQRDSCWSGTSVRKYPLNPLDLSALEPASMERWACDMDRYTDSLAALKKDEPQFNSFIRSSFSEEAHIILRSNPRYVTASNNSSSYDLYFVCLELHSCTSSFSVAQSTMVSIFSSPWPGSLNQLKDELLNQRIKVPAALRSMISSWSPS